MPGQGYFQWMNKKGHLSGSIWRLGLGLKVPFCKPKIKCHLRLYYCLDRWTQLIIRLSDQNIDLPVPQGLFDHGADLLPVLGKGMRACLLLRWGWRNTGGCDDTFITSDVVKGLGLTLFSNSKSIRKQGDLLIILGNTYGDNTTSHWNVQYYLPTYTKQTYSCMFWPLI